MCLGLVRHRLIIHKEERERKREEEKERGRERKLRGWRHRRWPPEGCAGPRRAVVATVGPLEKREKRKRGEEPDQRGSDREAVVSVGRHKRHLQLCGHET